MTNLLEETLEALAHEKKSKDDVLWVGSRDGKHVVTWEDFSKIANIDYDSGFGGQEVSSDLVVVGSEWWLERHEYDGSEGWSFQTRPVKSENPVPFATVCNGDSWASVEEMNRKGGKYGE